MEPYFKRRYANEHGAVKQTKPGKMRALFVTYRFNSRENPYAFGLPGFSRQGWGFRN
jgi:hypothetical protein